MKTPIPKTLAHSATGVRNGKGGQSNAEEEEEEEEEDEDEEGMSTRRQGRRICKKRHGKVDCWR